MNAIRPAAVAGAFYPASAEALSAQLRRAFSFVGMSSKCVNDGFGVSALIVLLDHFGTATACCQLPNLGGVAMKNGNKQTLSDAPVTRRAETGELKTVRFGRRILVPAAEVERVLSNGL